MRSQDFHVNRVIQYFLFALLALGVHFTIAYLLTPAVFQGALTEPDGYMRLVRVQELWETGAWLDRTIPRSNAPFGETLHWTRPFDVWLLLGAAPLSFFMPFRTALHAWAVVSTPLLLVAMCVAAVWASKPLLGSSGRFVVMVALLVQPAVMSYALPGRADHHVLIFLTFVLFVGALFRALGPNRAVHWERIAGLVLAFATWLTVESLVVWAALLVILAAFWIQRKGDFADRAATILATFGAAVLVATVLDGGIRSLAVAEYDRVSPVHVFMGVASFAAWTALRLASSRMRWTDTAAGRAGLIVGVGAIGAVVIRLVLPDFFQGPWAALTPEERSFWLGLINELQPVVPVPGRLGVFTAYLGPALICVPFAAWRLWKEPDRSVHACWVVNATLMAFYIPLGMSSMRFTPFPQILFGLIIAAVLATSGKAIAERTTPRNALLLRSVLTASLLGGFLVLGGLLSPEPEQREQVAPCLISELARELAPNESRVIVAHHDYGPEILYFTPHQVLGTVYHRNVEASLLTYSILTTSREDVARRLLASRDVNLILICPDQRGGFFGRESSQGGETLYARLVEGREPNWLRRRVLEREGTQGFILFDVDL